MIKTFKQFYEALTSTDMKNAIDLTIQKSQAPNPQQQQQQQQQQNPNDQITKQQATIKVTDLQKEINNLTIQKQNVAKEVDNLNNAQRDLAPTDPNQLKIFNQQQAEKMKANQDLLKALDQKILAIKNSITASKKTYLGN
jgi:hypothetical protein